MTHTSLESENTYERCSCDPQAWVPLSCSIVDGRIETDLYKKETDGNQYLMPTLDPIFLKPQNYKNL